MTFAAVIALIESILTLLLGIVMVAALLFAPIPASGQGPASPAFMRGIFIASSLLYILPAIWGISTSVALFRLKNWARISMIVFAALLIGLGGMAGLLSAFIPIPAASNGAVPSMAGVIRVFLLVFWLSLVGIGVWWLVFFRRPGVKLQFVPAGTHALASACQSLRCWVVRFQPRQPYRQDESVR